MFAGFGAKGACRIQLEADDRIMQRPRQLADFVVQAAVTRLVDFVNDRNGFTVIAFFEMVDQLARIGFERKFEFVGGHLTGITTEYHVCPRDYLVSMRSKTFSIFSLSAWAVKGLTT